MNVTHPLLHCASHGGYVFNMDETISTRRFGIGYLQKTCVVDIDAPGVWHGRHLLIYLCYMATFVYEVY